MIELEHALQAAGLRPLRIIPGLLQRCPVDGDNPGKKSGAYRLFDDGAPVCLWWNWRAGTSGSWHASGSSGQTPEERARMLAMMRQAQQERERAQADQWASNAERNAKQWEAAQHITDSNPAGLYLARRGLALQGTAHHALRYVPDLEYWDGPRSCGRHPAMLALVTAPSGAPVALHRTYLTRGGHKAQLPIVKKLTGTSGPMAGAAIKLHAPRLHGEELRIALGVAEGIETAIAAEQIAGIPVWPCVSATGLASFSPPAGLQALYVFADNDASGTGQKAAAELAQRAARAGLVVRILTPRETGTDWADWLASNKAG